MGSSYLPRAGQDDDADGIVALGLIEGLAKLLDRIGAKSVAVLRAIDGDRGDRVAPPIEDVLEIHRLKYMAGHFALRPPASRIPSGRASAPSRRPPRPFARLAVASPPPP